MAMRARIETTAVFHARSGIGASPNSSVIHWARRVSVTSSKPNKRAAPCATSSHRDAGSPEIVNKAISKYGDLPAFQDITRRYQERTKLVARRAQLDSIAIFRKTRNGHGQMAGDGHLAEKSFHDGELGQRRGAEAGQIRRGFRKRRQ